MIRICLVLAMVSGLVREAHCQISCVHPTKIQVPDDIVSCEIIETRRTIFPEQKPEIVIFPTVIYTQSHYDGWQECLRQFALDEYPLDRMNLGFHFLQIFQPYTDRGLQDGFDLCKKRLVELSRKTDLPELRKIAKQAIRTRYNVPSYGFRREEKPGKNEDKDSDKFASPVLHVQHKKKAIVTATLMEHRDPRRKDSRRYLLISHLNDKRLASPIEMPYDIPVPFNIELKLGMRYKLIGYQSLVWNGMPDWVFTETGIPIKSPEIFIKRYFVVVRKLSDENLEEPETEVLDGKLEPSNSKKS